MAIELSQLEPALMEQVQRLLQNCARQGVIMRPFSGVRTPLEQAVLWRQSRSIEEITLKINELRNQGATYLAWCLESVGPRHGKHVTNAIPGLSWHNWRQALDCFWLVDGQAEWSPERLVSGVNGYHVYAGEARALGLTAGGLWPNFKDWPHVQLRQEDNPGQAWSLAEIDRGMKQQFGGGA